MGEVRARYSARMVVVVGETGDARGRGHGRTSVSAGGHGGIFRVAVSVVVLPWCANVLVNT
jgi:hypothetical protein